MKFQTLISVALVSLFFTSSCGDNANNFNSLESRTHLEKAKSAYIKNDIDLAISEIEKELDIDPTNSTALSLLAKFKMAKAGFSELDLALKISGMGDNMSMSELAAALPAGTAANVAMFQAAVDALSRIPVNQRTAAQHNQLATAKVSLAVVLAKKSAGAEDGTLDKTKVDDINDADAALMVSCLNGASESLAAAGGDSSGASKLSSLSTGVNSQQGSSDAEKMRNYLKST